MGIVDYDLECQQYKDVLTSIVSGTKKLNSIKWGESVLLTYGLEEEVSKVTFLAFDGKKYEFGGSPDSHNPYLKLTLDNGKLRLTATVPTDFVNTFKNKDVKVMTPSNKKSSDNNNDGKVDISPDALKV